jgi:hypothetical protein
MMRRRKPALRQRNPAAGFRAGRARSAPRVRKSTLDRYLPHFDAVIRHGAVIPASPPDAYLWLTRFDFAQASMEVGRAIADIRAVPRFVAEVARKARHLPPGTTFILDDALRNGFVLLAQKPDRHVVLGAVGKLWKPRIELLPLTREEFNAFDAAKYVKAVTGFLVLPYGPDRTLVKLESRFLATDDSARTHFRRCWDAAEPFVAFFLRRVVGSLRNVAKEQRELAAAPPPWRRRG